ncbi:MAG: hypothetical protein N2560_00125 [Ignavibacteria bacterium]|nr:hypothetical protein [Ignavibacteria bacterium]
MFRNNHLPIIILLLFFSIQILRSQPMDNITDSTLYCIKYKFNLNDTLVYLVHSYDSIVIDYGKPLLKVRNEIHRIICEKITPNGTFILKYKLIEFSGRNFQDTTIVDYTENNWIGREVRIELDSLGNRLNFWVDDSLKSGSTPGGPFQPHLLFPFQDTCKRKNETWLVRTTEDLVENGIPIPRLRHTMLFKMLGEIDTLGEKVIRSEFIRTGQGFLLMHNQAGELKVTSVINSYGYLDFSNDKKIPLHLFTTVEQKLTFSSSNTLSTGKHYINSNYTLVDYRKGKEIQKEKQKKVRKSKR